MKINFRNIFSCILAAAVTAALAWSLVKKREGASSLRCTGIAVQLVDSTRNKFLSSGEVVRIVDRDFGGYVNRPAEKIDLQKVENVLKKQAFIEDCQAVMEKDGVLAIRLSQCSPLLRIMTDSTHMSYLTPKGDCFRVKEDWCRRLKTADGVMHTEDKEWMRSLGRLAEKIDEDRTLKSQVSRISCTEGKEVHIRLSGRKEIFDLGTPTGLDEKISAVVTYLGRIVPLGKEYETVTVKYRGQIVCR